MIIIRHGRRWAIVVDNGSQATLGKRTGYWCDDANGGWGVSDWSPEEAIKACGRPVTYQTRKEAEADGREFSN